MLDKLPENSVWITSEQEKENASSILLKEAFSYSLLNTEVLDKVGESHMYTLDSPILYSEEPQRWARLRSAPKIFAYFVAFLRMQCR